MTTLVISDLHLGATSGVDLLRRPEIREALVARLRDGVERLVILGDGLELREIPVGAAAEHGRALLSAAGEALGPDGEIVMLAGNHDHGLLAGWTETHLMQTPPHTMGLEHRIDPRDAGPVPQGLAEAGRPAKVSFAYPGVWLRDDVYGIHGHYLDLHTTVPTIERLAAGAMARFVAPLPETGATADDYEAVLAPLYAWMYALAQRSNDGVVRNGARSSARAWVAMAGEGRRERPIRSAAMLGGMRGAVVALNAAGIGPVRGELSGVALRRGSLTGMGEVVRRLGIRAEHVVFGHSHRAGPWPGDDESEWITPTGVRLVNTGSWVYQRHFLSDRSGAGPYWPGTVAVVEGSGPPRLERLLGERTHEELRPPDQA